MLSSISAWLRCQLGTHANLVFRYERQPTGKQSSRVVEVWFVPESFDDATPLLSSSEQVEPDLTATWFERIRVKNPQQRIDAVTDLANQAINNKPELQDALELAFSDPNAEVRVQAIGGLAKLNNERALNALHRALLDKDVSVRLMTVDNAGNNTALLEQALNDNDESVRSFAALKLNTLERRP
ncbi:MAG: HEAT repeat domain-containing protein [Methylococcaceae bacterium]